MAANVDKHSGFWSKKMLHAFFVMFVLFLGLKSLGQEESSRRFKFGLFVAPSLTWTSFKTENIDGRGVVPQINYGLFTDFAIKGSQRYFVSTGLHLNSFGGRYAHSSVESINGTLYQAETEVVSTTRYLEMPLLIKMRSNELGYSILGGYAGFGTGFRLAAHQNRNTSVSQPGVSKQIEQEKENVEDKLNPMRFAFVAGIELERKITKETYFTIGLTFNKGLSNVFSTAAYETDEKGNIDFTKVKANGEANGDRLKARHNSVLLHFGIYF
jgi:hypothetical protein